MSDYLFICPIHKTPLTDLRDGTYHCFIADCKSGARITKTEGGGTVEMFAEFTITPIDNEPK